MGMRRTFANLAKQLSNVQFQKSSVTSFEAKPSYTKYFIIIPILLIVAGILYSIPFVFKAVPRAKPPIVNYSEVSALVKHRVERFITKFKNKLHDEGEKSIEEMWFPEMPPSIKDENKRIVRKIENPAFMTLNKIAVIADNPECKNLVFADCSDVFKNKYTFRLKKRDRSFYIVTIEPTIETNQDKSE